MSRPVVCMTVCGHDNYRRAAAIAVQSVLDMTDMRVFVGVDFPPPGRWTDDPRMELYTLPTTGLPAGAPQFLRKFETISAATERYPGQVMVHMDADAVVVRSILGADVRSALGGMSFAMVEQKTISGSNQERDFFLRHYARHALRWFDNAGVEPTLGEYRFFNSGVVLGRDDAMRRLAEWSLAQIGQLPAHHRVGTHMIGDQDYFQYWCNTLHPGSCRELDWYWNHCEHWDTGFPRDGALICHFSNFCHGPTSETIERMRSLAGESRS